MSFSHRATGVRIDLYRSFVILDLKPLNEEQQRAVVETQLGGSEYFDHLLQFLDKDMHDHIYQKRAFRDPTS